MTLGLKICLDLVMVSCRESINILKIFQVVQLTKFDYRLASNLDEDLQKLRCRVNYHALRFTKPIQELGQKIVTRMRKMAKRFIAIHLRFVHVFTCIMYICILQIYWIT